MCANQIFTLRQNSEKAQEKKRRVHVGFIGLEKIYDRVDKEALQQIERMYDAAGKPFNGIKRMYAIVSFA